MAAIMMRRGPTWPRARNGASSRFIGPPTDEASCRLARGPRFRRAAERPRLWGARRAPACCGGKIGGAPARYERAGACPGSPVAIEVGLEGQQANLVVLAPSQIRADLRRVVARRGVDRVGDFLPDLIEDLLADFVLNLLADGFPDLVQVKKVELADQVFQVLHRLVCHVRLPSDWPQAVRLRGWRFSTTPAAVGRAALPLRLVSCRSVVHWVSLPAGSHSRAWLVLTGCSVQESLASVAFYLPEYHSARHSARLSSSTFGQNLSTNG